MMVIMGVGLSIIWQKLHWEDREAGELCTLPSFSYSEHSRQINFRKEPPEIHSHHDQPMPNPNPCQKNKVPSKRDVGGRFTIPNFASEYRAWGRDGTRKHVNPAGIRRQFGAVFDPWMMMEIWSKKAACFMWVDKNPIVEKCSRWVGVVWCFGALDGVFIVGEQWWWWWVRHRREIRQSLC